MSFKALVHTAGTAAIVITADDLTITAIIDFITDYATDVTVSTPRSSYFLSYFPTFCIIFYLAVRY